MDKQKKTVESPPDLKTGDGNLSLEELSDSPDPKAETRAVEPKKLKSQLQKSAALADSPSLANQPPLEPEEGEKNKKKSRKTAREKEKTRTKLAGEDTIQILQARKIQMMKKPGLSQEKGSLLQLQLLQSDSLRIAQEKISDLEEELCHLRQKNEELASAGKLLKDQNDLLKSKLEEEKGALREEKDSSKREKEIFSSAMEEAKRQISRLRSKKQELEKRLSNDIFGIRARESSLESRIEILKMENSTLQREKDKKIIELKKQMQKTKINLEEAYRKSQDLQALNVKLRESSRRAVSALRATIYSLESAGSKEETQFLTEESSKSKKIA